MSIPVNALLGQPQSAPTLDLIGWSRRSYRFELYPFGYGFKKLPGLYAILQKTAPNTFRVLYIGETHDLDARVGSGFMGHHKWAAAVLDGATHIGVLVVGGDRSNRLAMETDLRQSYRPPLNDQ